jgi:glycerol-3-phosphate dehydrogenase
LVHVRARVRRVTIETAQVNERHGGGIALERYDLIIVGGGAAGINALKAAVTLKAQVALVDRGPLGGTCVNRG